MIYVTSSSVKHNKIKDSVEELVNNGFRNIELSGGTEYYNGFLDDLLELKAKYNLNYICHNYFPPPEEHFVLNLASLNDEIYLKTFEHLVSTIELSKKLGATRFGFHAGFFIDIKVSEIGKKITREELFDKHKSIQRFCDGFNKLEKIAKELNIYIENNVFSSTNAKTYDNENIFMLTSSEEYNELKKIINANLLLDIGHLKVSSTTLNLNFENELKYMLDRSDYIHISDNDGFHDLNQKMDKNSNIIMLLKKQNLKNKIFTLEIYERMDDIKRVYKILEDIVDD